jgi:hypothetical protein
MWGQPPSAVRRAQPARGGMNLPEFIDSPIPLT